ncbi:transcriptional regulator, partial [Pseudomonas chlororaphis]|nr:transcriptional regulator [Pseudomonas chlororaphis]
MQIRPIHTDQDYRAALKQVSVLFDNEPEPGTAQGDYFDVMITLIEA